MSCLSLLNGYIEFQGQIMKKRPVARWFHPIPGNAASDCIHWKKYGYQPAIGLLLILHFWHGWRWDGIYKYCIGYVTKNSWIMYTYLQVFSQFNPTPKPSVKETKMAKPGLLSWRSPCMACNTTWLGEHKNRWPPICGLLLGIPWLPPWDYLLTY